MAITSVFSTEIYGIDKLKGFVELQPNIALDKHVPSTIGVDIGVLTKVNDNFSFGGGIGFREKFKFNSGSLPIFVRVQAEGNNGNIIPYGSLDLGYEISLSDVDNASGIIINPTIGLKFGAFSLGVGYYGTVNASGGSGGISSNINLRLGYTFGLKKSNSPFAKAMRKLEFPIELNYNIPLGVRTANNPDANVYNKFTPSFGFNASALYPVTEELYVGPTIGYNSCKCEIEDHDGESWDETNFSFAAKGRYKPNNMKIMSVLQPFATVDLGLEMFYMQLHYAAQIGISYELKNSHSLDLGVGYQRMYSDSNYEHDTKGYNAMKISLGYTF